MPVTGGLLAAILFLTASSALEPDAARASRAAAESSQTTIQEPTTRAELLRRQREAKQADSRPYEPNALESGMHFVEDRLVPLLQRDGVYARLGSLTTDSGFAYGAGYRKRAVVDGRGTLDVWAASSVEKYWTVDGRASYPLMAGGEVVVEGYGRRYSFPSVEFSGLGPDSLTGDISDFNTHGGMAGGGVRLAPGRVVRAGAAVEYLWPRTGSGSDGESPSIEQVFVPDQIPGFGVRTNFLRTAAFVEIDYREPLNARKGGWYRLDVSRYLDRTAGQFTFYRTDLDLRQYVSFLSERRVLAGRVFVATTNVDEARQIPFYLIPSLGGRDSLRGFEADRFRGPHAVLLQGEYRFEIWAGLDGALFYDAGKVANRRADLNLRDLEQDYGIGFRFNTDNGVIVRIDTAFGSREGRRLHVVFGGIF